MTADRTKEAEQLAAQASVSLREYLESQIKWLDRCIDSRISTTRVEIEKAEVQLSERLAHMNEVRGALKDQAATFLTKPEYDLAYSGIEKRVRGLELDEANREGRSKTTAITVSALISISSALASLAAVHWGK